MAGPARQLRVTPVPGDAEAARGPLMTFTTDEIVEAPTDAIVDAETGCLLRLISFSGDALVIWSELDDISTEPADPDEFRVHVPPGTRIVEELIRRLRRRECELTRDRRDGGSPPGHRPQSARAAGTGPARVGRPHGENAAQDPHYLRHLP